jgi:hypothetical protein
MEKRVIKIWIQYATLGAIGLLGWEFIKYMICKF